jgi:hypothetical protein
MKKILLILTIFSLFSTDISAQFGMGGGGGGFPGMGGGTRKDMWLIRPFQKRLNMPALP